MLISSSTGAYTEIGRVATTIFSDFSTPLIFIVGIILGFYILERIIGIFYPQNDIIK